MKSILLAFLAAIPLVFAQTAVENDLVALRRQREVAIAKAKEPIDRKYREELEKLLARAIQSGTLDTAERVKRELLALEESNAKQDTGPFVGTFWAKGIDGDNFSIARFKPNGSFEEWDIDSKILYTATYNVAEKEKASMEYKREGYKFVYTLQGDKLTRSDGTKWVKITEKQYNAVISAKSFTEALAVVAKDTPFGRRNP